MAYFFSKHYLPFFFLLFWSQFVFSQSSVIVRNSTWQEFEVSVQQSGTHQMQQTEWAQLLPNAKAWKEGDSEIFQTNRDAASIPENDTVYFDIKLSGNTDTLTIKLRIIGVTGGSSLAYSISGNSFSQPWQTDGNFHELQTTLAGKSVIIKYKPDNDDSGYSRDVRFAIHDLPVYEIDETDFQNPDVLNIVAYNIQMLPGGVSGLPQLNDRADHLPANYSPWQDVVINEEAFDLIARPEHLNPAMEAAGFPYRTTVLNDPPGGGLPTNGGVIIYSRWPIEATAEIQYSLCGPSSSDCLSQKGVKYARINKLGKKYHVFGTHMDAGSDEPDITARHVQIGEIRRFIDSLNIPTTEAVLLGGDFNISPLSIDSLYFRFMDTLNPVVPYPVGDDDSNFSDIPGKIIDHIWASSRHLVPLEATNEIITVRSLEPVLWDLSEFSDHRCVLGRFVYPDLSTISRSDTLCPHDNLLLEVSSNPLYPYQWKKNGADIPGETGNSYSLQNVVETDGGFYQCALSYDVTFGDTANNNIVHFLYPDGARVFHATPTFNFDIVVDSVLCTLSIDDKESISPALFPNPSDGIFFINNSTNQNGFLEIYSATGALIFNTTLLPGINKLEVKQSAGIYFAVMKIGEKIIAEKIVVR